MFTVCAWSPPVPTTSTARPVHRHPPGVAQHRLGQPGDLRGRLALAAQRHQEPRELDGGRVAREHLVHHPRGVLRVQVGARDQAGEQRGPGLLNVSAIRARPAQRARGQPAAGAAQHVGDGLGGGQRVERVHEHRVGLRPGGQPTVVPPPHRHDDRRAVGDLVLELPGQAHAAGGLGLAVEDREVDAARVHGGQHVRDPARLDEADPRQTSGAGRRPTAMVMASRTSGRWLNTSTVVAALTSGLLTDGTVSAQRWPPGGNHPRSWAVPDAAFAHPAGSASSAGCHPAKSLCPRQAVEVHVGS